MGPSQQKLGEKCGLSAHPETRISTTKAQSSQSRNLKDQRLSFVSSVPFVVVHAVYGESNLIRRLPRL